MYKYIYYLVHRKSYPIDPKINVVLFYFQWTKQNTNFVFKDAIITAQAKFSKTRI